MKRKMKPVLTGARIQLRVLQEEDLPKVYSWKNDYELAGSISAHPMPVARHEVEAWFRKNQADRNQFLFGIYHRRSGRVLGLARLMFVDWISSNTELGIYIADDKYRRKGLGRESVNLLLNFAFGELNLHKVYLRVSELNKSALALYHACGFQVEGKLREQHWSNGRYENVIMMGILRRGTAETLLQGPQENPKKASLRRGKFKAE